MIKKNNHSLFSTPIKIMFGCLFFLILLFISAPSLSSLSSSHLSIKPLWNSPVHSHRLTISPSLKLTGAGSGSLSPSHHLSSWPTQSQPRLYPSLSQPKLDPPPSQPPIASDLAVPTAHLFQTASDLAVPANPLQVSEFFLFLFFFFDELVNFFIWVFVVLA